MTKPSYLIGWAAWSQARGRASSPGDYAWNVNFNNGNANYNNQDNKGLVRAVRARECQDAVSLRDLHTAWRQARRGKRPSANQLQFDTRWIDGLIELQGRLNDGTWAPSPPTCFIARLPKAREIHAPDFSDRIVHHWLVPQLERIFEPGFIFDSFSNRTGKGTHAAVDRLQRFIRQVHSGQSGGWYLQLDLRNFFNSIHRPTLYGMLKTKMERAGLGLAARRATHALLRQGATAGGVHYASTETERARVPAHKRLENAAPGCGLAIGNLSSQFFANVYLDTLDQFVKHELKVPRYVRYVDDFVLVHRDPEQLRRWQQQIERFLQDRLRLELKADIKLKPLSTGCDFLGYIVFPTHCLVRQRVVGHARQKLQAWETSHVRGARIRATPAELEALRSTWSSYEGHFRRASSRAVRVGLRTRFPWLVEATRPRRMLYWKMHRPFVMKLKESEL